MTAGNKNDPFHLQRFLDAQKGSYSAALAELRAGRKRSHWMWYIFPQLKGLGYSPTASYYAIESLAGARAYLSHTVLGSRLRECTAALLANNGSSASDVFGYPDDLKFCSSMTLFSRAAEQETLFDEALDRYCGGHRDDKTLAMLRVPRS